MQFFKTINGKRKKAPLFVKIDGKLQRPSVEWYAKNGYAQCDVNDSGIEDTFTHSADPVLTETDVEQVILQNIYNHDNSIVIQKTEQYFNSDVSLIQCFWGEDEKHVNAVKEALSINASFTHPGEWIFVEAQTSRRNCKFNLLCEKFQIKYKFVKIEKRSEGIFLKTALWNAGAKMAALPKIAFLDADIAFCRFDWLKSVSNALDENDVISLHSKCYYAKQPFNGQDSLLDGYKMLNLSRGFTEKHNMRTIGHSGFSIGMTKAFFETAFKMFDVIPGKSEDMLYWYKITGVESKNVPYKDVYKYGKIKENLKIGYGDAICCHICHGPISERNYKERRGLAGFVYDKKRILPYYKGGSVLEKLKGKACSLISRKTKIDWSRFDKIYCIHYLPYPERLDQIKRELSYVGLLDMPQFEFYYTAPNSFYNYILKDSTPAEQQQVYIGNVNLHVNRLNLMLQANRFGYKRILVLEDDIVFHNDLRYIKDCIDNFPTEYDIVNFDPYIVGQPDYTRQVNGFFKEAGNITYNCSCVSFSAKAISRYIQAVGQEQLAYGVLFPGDNVNLWADCEIKRCVCGENICVQREFADRMNMFGSSCEKYFRLNPDNYSEKKGKPRSKKPEIRFEIDITRECNWKCASCNRLCDRRSSNKSSYMTLDEIKSIAKQIKRVSRRYMVSKVKILGGEPTLHPMFREICQIVKRELYSTVQNHNICIGTNGSHNQVYEEFITREMGFKIIGDDKTLPFKNEQHRNMLLSPAETGQKIASLPCWVFYECGVNVFKQDGKVLWYWCGCGSVLATLLNRKKLLKKSLKALLESGIEDLYGICQNCQCAAVEGIKHSDNQSISEVFKEGLGEYEKGI